MKQSEAPQFHDSESLLTLLAKGGGSVSLWLDPEQEAIALESADLGFLTMTPDDGGFGASYQLDLMPAGYRVLGLTPVTPPKGVVAHLMRVISVYLPWHAGLKPRA